MFIITVYSIFVFLLKILLLSLIQGLLTHLYSGWGALRARAAIVGPISGLYVAYVVCFPFVRRWVTSLSL